MAVDTLGLGGLSLVGDGVVAGSPKAFRAVNPATGAELETEFFSASAHQIELAATVAEAAFPIYAAISGKERAAFLRRIAG